MRGRTARYSRGFTMVEVMVALVVISVGLLGIAKMQALALSSTGTARTRSIAALEAASLAAMVRADRAYWSAVTTPPAFAVTFKGGVVTGASDNALLTVNACNTALSCPLAAQITAYDLQDWAATVNTLLPTSQAQLTCLAGAAPAPVSCTIDINWTENRVGINAQSDPKATNLNTSFRLYVEP